MPCAQVCWSAAEIQVSCPLLSPRRSSYLTWACNGPYKLLTSIGYPEASTGFQPPGWYNRWRAAASGSRSEITDPTRASESSNLLFDGLDDGVSFFRGFHASSLQALRPDPPASGFFLSRRLQDSFFLPATGFLDSEGCRRRIHPPVKETHRR